MPFWDADSGEDERGAAVAVYAVVQGTRVKLERPRFTPVSPLRFTSISTLPLSSITSAAVMMATNAPIAGFGIVHFPATPDRSDLSKYDTTAKMLDPTEINTGFTPLINQQDRFESFKSTQSRSFHVEKQGTVSVLKLDANSGPLTPSGNHSSGLLLVASADIILETTRYSTIKTAFPRTVEKDFKSEAIEEHQKKVVYHIVDCKQEKKLRSAIKAITTYDEETRVLHCDPIGNNVVPRKYQPRKSLPTTFHKFGGLPIELRYKIWGLAVPSSRVVEFTVRGENREIFKPRKTGIPAALQACHESRLTALKTLKPMFHTIAKADAYNYFDPSTDVLKLNLRSAQLLALTRDFYADKDRELVRHLQIPCHIDPNDPFMANAIATLIVRAPFRSWGSLESLYLSGREKREKKAKIGLRVELPGDWESANDKIVPFAKKIEKKIKEAREEHGRRIDIAIMIRYK